MRTKVNHEGLLQRPKLEFHPGIMTIVSFNSNEDERKSIGTSYPGWSIINGDEIDILVHHR